MTTTVQFLDVPKIIEVCKFQSSVAICEELAVAFVIHVGLYSLRGVERFPFLIAPQANLPNTNFFSWSNNLREKYEQKLSFISAIQKPFTKLLIFTMLASKGPGI